MSSTTVAEFANELKKSADVLLDQLRSAGVAKASDSDVLTDADKQKLLSYLQTSHGTVTADRKKITLVKKSTSEIKQADASGKARTIQVEVRKKRTVLKRDDEPSAVVDEPVVDHADLARREEEARHQAELISRQEQELAEMRRQREAQEAQQRSEMAAQEAQAQADAKALAEAALAAGEAGDKPALSRADREQLARAEAASINAASQTKPTPVVAAEDKAVSKAAEAADAAAAAAAKLKADQAAREAAVLKAAADSKAKAEEETARAQELDSRRRKALAEAEAIRSMMNAPKKVLVAKKDEPKVEPKAAVKGTLHKPAGTPAPGARAAAAQAAAPASPGANKEVKSAKLPSS